MITAGRCFGIEKAALTMIITATAPAATSNFRRILCNGKRISREITLTRATATRLEAGAEELASGC